MVEQVFQDWHTAEPQNNIILLRYFNPVGAHPSGRIGEDPNGIPLNLLPFVTQVAVGVHERLNIVVDLAMGHVKALEKLEENPGVEAYNLGTGRPYSVLEVVESFKRVSGQDIAYQIVDRRQGDLPTSYADPSKANNVLNWHATRTLDEMCADAWRWQSNNPNGYNES